MRGIQYLEWAGFVIIKHYCMLLSRFAIWCSHVLFFCAFPALGVILYTVFKMKEEKQKPPPLPTGQDISTKSRPLQLDSSVTNRSDMK